jgi:hypothetical protein
MTPWYHKDKLDALLAEIPYGSAIIAYDMVLGQVLRHKCEEFGRQALQICEVKGVLPLPQVWGRQDDVLSLKNKTISQVPNLTKTRNSQKRIFKP